MRAYLSQEISLTSLIIAVAVKNDVLRCGHTCITMLCAVIYGAKIILDFINNDCTILGIGVSLLNLLMHES